MGACAQKSTKTLCVFALCRVVLCQPAYLVLVFGCIVFLPCVWHLMRAHCCTWGPAYNNNSINNHTIELYSNVGVRSMRCAVACVTPCRLGRGAIARLASFGGRVLLGHSSLGE